MKHCRLIVFLLIVGSFGVVRAEENDHAVDEAEKRLDMMRRAISAVKITPLDKTSQLMTEFEKKPLLRFGDASRRTHDGALWKLGTGRPQVIVSLEFNNAYNRPSLSYEFLCLVPERFELVTHVGWKWKPDSSALKFQQISEASPPNRTSPAVRLRQMKQLARRFEASEQHGKKDFGLRLMPQPIDRYTVNEKQGFEGAAFVFANGTNPEVLLLIESNKEGWQYGLARLCGAAPTVTLDGEKVWTLPPKGKLGKSWELNYATEAHPVEEIPNLNDK